MADNTAAKQPAHLRDDLKFKPGQSGNPAGRPKGSRVKLAEQFLSDLLTDWAEHGAEAIKKMREEKAADYVKTVAATLPKELNVKVSELDELSDEQLAHQFAAVTAQLARAGIGLVEGALAESKAHSLN